MKTFSDGHAQTDDERDRDLRHAAGLLAQMPPMILPDASTLEQEEEAVREYFCRSKLPTGLEGYGFNGILAFNRLMERLKAEPAQFVADDATGVR